MFNLYFVLFKMMQEEASNTLSTRKASKAQCNQQDLQLPVQNHPQQPLFTRRLRQQQQQFGLPLNRQHQKLFLQLTIHPINPAATSMLMQFPLTVQLNNLETISTITVFQLIALFTIFSTMPNLQSGMVKIIKFGL